MVLCPVAFLDKFLDTQHGNFPAYITVKGLIQGNGQICILVPHMYSLCILVPTHQFPTGKPSVPYS